MCAVCSECSLNLVAGQVFVGTCSVGFFSNLYYQGTNVAGYIVLTLVHIHNIIIILSQAYFISFHFIINTEQTAAQLVYSGKKTCIITGCCAVTWTNCMNGLKGILCLLGCRLYRGETSGGQGLSPEGLLGQKTHHPGLLVVVYGQAYIVSHFTCVKILWCWKMDYCSPRSASTVHWGTPLLIK